MPHGTGKGQQHTMYDNVKEHIVRYVQKTYKLGEDIAESLENEEMIDLTSKKPMRKISIEKDAAVKKIEQDGFDLDYQTDYRIYSERVVTLNSNTKKAFALIMENYCSKAMQVRVKELSDYQTKIHNDPIELPKAIKILMHEPI